MIGHCGYRSPCVRIDSNAVGGIFDRTPDYWICACPAGEHALGLNCVDKQEKCKIAWQYEQRGGTSINYSNKRGRRLLEEQQIAVESAIEGLPDELATAVRKAYQLRKKKEKTTTCQSSD